MRLSKLESLAGEPDLDPCRCVIELYFLSLSHPFRSHARDEPLSSGFQASVSIPSGTSVSFNSYSCPEFCVLYLLHIVVGRDGEVVPRMYWRRITIAVVVSWDGLCVPFSPKKPDLPTQVGCFELWSLRLLRKNNGTLLDDFRVYQQRRHHPRRTNGQTRPY